MGSLLASDGAMKWLDHTTWAAQPVGREGSPLSVTASLGPDFSFRAKQSRSPGFSSKKRIKEARECSSNQRDAWRRGALHVSKPGFPWGALIVSNAVSISNLGWKLPSPSTVSISESMKSRVPRTHLPLAFTCSEDRLC